MKYWLLTSEYPPFYGGGISTYCRFTAEMMAEKGHEVSVFVYDYSVKGIKIKIEESIRVIRFNPSKTKSSSFLGYITNIGYEYAHIVKQFIENEGKPDIIESQEYLGIAYYLLQYKYLLYDWCVDIPIVITVHSPSFLYHEYNKIPLFKYPDYWIAEMERFCLQAADQLISPSKYIIKEIKDRFVITNDRIEFIPNPYILPQQTSKKITDLNQAQEIVFYGKLTVQKGIFKLLDYFRKLWDGGFTHSLSLIGGDDIFYHPENDTMGSLIRKQNKKYIQSGLLKIVGKIKPEKLSQKLSSASVVIIPSVVDNLPYTVLEMMGMGKIVLASRQGGQAEVIEDGIDGFIFDHNDSDSFSKQLKKILLLDPDRKEKISEQAIQKIRNKCNADIVYEKKNKIIEELLNERNKKDKFPFIRSSINPSVQSNGYNENEKLSIIVPYFNMGEYIDDTIDSLLKTDYHNKEILIINDGSTDVFSIKKLEQYRNKEGIRVIDKPNEGIGKTRNFGATKADGKFLAFLDADDTVGSTYYSEAIKVLSTYKNVHFIGCWTHYFDYSKSIWPTFQPEPPLILYHNLVNSSALVYKRDSFIKYGMNEYSMPFQGLEDYESVIAMIEKGYDGVVIPEILFNYRVRQNSMIRSISDAKWLKLYEYIKRKHKELYTTFASEITALENTNGEGYKINNPTLDHYLISEIGMGKKISTSLIRLIKRNPHIRTIAYRLYKTIKK